MQQSNIMIASATLLPFFQLSFVRHFSISSNIKSDLEDLYRHKTPFVVVPLVSEGNKQEYGGVVNDYVNWSECNHLHIITRKT